MIDGAISQQLKLLRLAAGERRAVLAILTRLQEDVSQRAGLAVQESTVFGRGRESQLYGEVERAIAGAYREVTARHIETLRGLGEWVADQEAESLRVYLEPIPAPPPVVLPLAGKLAALADDALVMGAPTAEWWSRQEVATMEAFRDAVRVGVAGGETGRQIARRVSEALGVTLRNAEALARTGVASVANAARLATWRENSDIIKGIEQVSTLDGRTTLICAAYSGAKWDLDGKPAFGTPSHLKFNGGPPRHWRCRSTTVPITKTFRELGADIDEPPEGKRAAEGGPVSESTTFDAWLSARDELEQDKQLGKGRAALWRAGKISLSDLVSGTGRELTLEQLKRGV